VPNKLQVVRSIAELRGVIAQWRNDGHRIGLVPTMGALHSGHLGLVRRATQLADRTLVSIFVNPSQFAPHEDLARYPRDEAGDLAKLAAESCHLVWAPSAAEMYPDGFATRIAPAGTAQGLESDFRPHFFGGVATVCAKHYQQLCVVRQMVRDLNMPIDIVGVETTREADGLALSSRNAYLTAAERKVAPALNRVLREVAGKANAVMRGAGPAKNKPPRPTPLVRDPTLPPQAHQLPDLDAVCAAAAAELLAAGFAKVDYVAVRHADTLKVVTETGAAPLRVLAAAWLGATRLIDNVDA
jgi:pantoate--beta-alanine ligase